MFDDPPNDTQYATLNGRHGGGQLRGQQRLPVVAGSW